MVKFVVSLFVIFIQIAVSVNAQNLSKDTSICFNTPYILEILNSKTSNSDTKSSQCKICRLEVTVNFSKNKLPCAIIVNTTKLIGSLLKNLNEENKLYNVYNFYVKGKKNILLTMNFYKEQGRNKVDIINDNYLKIFKPCFDRKYITIAGCQNPKSTKPLILK